MEYEFNGRAEILEALARFFDADAISEMDRMMNTFVLGVIYAAVAGRSEDES